MNSVDPIRDAETVHSIGEYLKTKDPKYYVMFTIGIYSGLRISDILKLKVRDVKGKKKITLREKKTGKEKCFFIHPKLKPILEEYCKDKDYYEYLIPSPHRVNKPISRVYAYLVLREAGEKFGIPNLGTHSLRKTFGYHFYQQTKDIALLMKYFNHSDESKTLRYIGITQDTMDKAIQKLKY